MAIRTPPDNDLNWGAEVRAAITAVNGLEGTTTASVTTALANKAAATHNHGVADLTATGTRSSSTYLRGDNTWATPPSSGGTTAATGQTVYSAEPPAGLTAIAANGSTNDYTNLQAHLNYVESTWGSGFVRLPSGTITVNSGLTIPEGVQLCGISKAETVLDFTSAGTSVVAVTAGGRATFPLRDLKLKGPNGTDKIGYPTNTCTGARLHGIDCRIQNVAIESFFYGLDLTEDDSFFFLGDNIAIGYAGVCIDIDHSPGHNGGVSPAENGERMVITNSVLFNSKTGFDARGSGITLFFSNTSLDYLGHHGIIGDAFIEMVNCHLETGYAPTDNGNWGSVDRFMFQPFNTARLAFTNCRFEVRDSGVYQVADPGAGPSNYNSGWIRFGNCTWYGNIPTGGSRQYQSKDMVNWVSDSTTTLDVYSPFGTKWNAIHAYPVSTDASSTPSGYGVRIVSSDVSSVAGSVPTQKVVLGRVVPSGASAPYPQMWVVVEY